MFPDGSLTETRYGWYADLPAAERPALTADELARLAPVTYVKAYGPRAAGAAANDAGATVRYYAPAGRLVLVMQPQVRDAENGGALARPVWKYEYDAAGNQTDEPDRPAGQADRVRVRRAGAADEPDAAGRGRGDGR